MMEFLNGRVKVVVGDITRQSVDAIVNAANPSLLGGAGVDGAIHRAGGASILEECRELRRTRFPEGLPVGDAVLTTAGRLPARYVIHTVGPVWESHAGREAELLSNCYRNSLALAAAHSLVSLAFPAISTGAYAFPRAQAAQVSSRSIKDFLAADDSVEEVRLVFFSRGDADVFLSNHNFKDSDK